MGEIETLLGLVNAGGVLTVLLVLFVMFYRGDLLSRRVYEELTERLLGDLSARVIAGVGAMLKEARDDDG